MPRPVTRDGLVSDPGIRKTLRMGWVLLAVAIPFGVTLEALHAFKVQGYLAHETRRELWRLAHAHGTLLGILCLVFAALADRHIEDAARPGVAGLIRWGAILMPLGFFLGGVMNSEGDPSLGIALVPAGAALLFVGLLRCAFHRVR
ncbi:MAG: hypothetical protein H7X95_06100 [Deltaproteobacteria bacterium]|nr:hypothetical protein [Deltaproteobacteria bacterium]